jgi:hypothetical protein
MAGDVAFEAAFDLAWCLAFGGFLGGVGAGGWIVLETCEDDRVQGAVELAFTAAVEAIAHGLAGGRGDWCGAAEHRERAIVAEPAGVRPGAEQLRGADRADADLVQQPRHVGLDELLELGFEVVGFGLEGKDPSGGVTQRDHGRPVLGRVRWQRPQSSAASDELVGVMAAELVA